MKIDNKKVSECRVALTINAAAEEIKDDYNRVVKSYIKDAPIPGFRRGKAPLAVIQKRYGAQMQNEINNTLISRFLRDATKEADLKVVSVVNIDGVVCSEATGISFTATIDVEPEFKLPKYQKLGIAVNDCTPSADEVEAEIVRARQSYAKSEETEEAAKENDYVEISFEATGKGLEDLADDAKRFVKSEKFWAVAGAEDEREAIPGIAKALLGLKKGDEFAFETKFPADYRIEALRKLKAKYTGKVISVRAIILPSDEDLCKSLAVESLDQFREKLSEYLKQSKESAEKNRISAEITEALTKKASFELPASELEDQVGYFASDIAERDARAAGAADVNAYVAEHADDIKKKAEEEAAKLLRLRYICKAIAAEQDIKVNKADIDAEIDRTAYYLAMREGKNAPSADELRKRIIQSGRLPVFEAEICKQKVIDWIIEDIKAAK